MRIGVRSPAAPRPVVARALVTFGLLCALGCGQTAESRLTEVQALHQIGDFSGSISALREILARDPDHAEANYLLGLALTQTKQPTLAIWPLRKAADSEEYEVLGSLLLASALMQTDGYEEAITAVTHLLEVDPGNVGGLLLRATAYLETGNPEAALADAEQILTVEPEHLRALGTKGQSLLKLERNEESEAAWIQLEGILSENEDPSQGVRGCIALAGFYHETKSDKLEPTLVRCLESYPGEVLALHTASRHYNETGQQEKSIELWQRAVAEEPDRNDLRIQLATLLSNQGRSEEAEAALVEAAELFDDVQTWNRLAMFYQNQSQGEKALEALDRSLAQAPDPPPDLLFRKADLLIDLEQLEAAEEIAAGLDEIYRNLIRGRLLAARGDRRGALDALEAALTRWPNNAYARFLAGTLAEELGMRDKAIAQYREAHRANAKATDAALRAALLEMADGNYSLAGEYARAHAKSRPFTGPEPHVVGVRAATALGEYETARTILKDLSAIPGNEATVLLERAAVERSAQGREAAVELVVAADPDFDDPSYEHVLRTYVEDLVILGRGEEALARSEAALAAHPDAASYLDLHGRLLYALDRPAEARVQFERARELDPEYAPALVALARLAADEGRVDEAVALAEAAVAADASDRDAGFLLAQLLASQGRSDEAAQQLRTLLAEHPGHAGAANDLAWQLAREGSDLDEALVLAGRATRLQPSAHTFDTLGWVQLKRGDAIGATESLEKALELDPRAASIRYRYGLALEELGRSDEAVDALREALGAGPFPEAEAARAEVARLEGRSP
ncbi:MAG: tetratricopeptide repeat protein [Myxococcota bacterium]